MQTQLKIIEGDQMKGKSSRKCQNVTDKLQYLMDFDLSISLAMAKTMQHLSEFVFISMTNLTLALRDSYLDHLRSGIEQDTLGCSQKCSLTAGYTISGQCD